MSTFCASTMIRLLLWLCSLVWSQVLQSLDRVESMSSYSYFSFAKLSPFTFEVIIKIVTGSCDFTGCFYAWINYFLTSPLLGFRVWSHTLLCIMNFLQVSFLNMFPMWNLFIPVLSCSRLTFCLLLYSVHVRVLYILGWYEMPCLVFVMKCFSSLSIWNDSFPKYNSLGR